MNNKKKYIQRPEGESFGFIIIVMQNVIIRQETNFFDENTF